MSESSKEQQTSAFNDTNLNYWNTSWQTNKLGFHRTAVSK